MGKRKIKDEAWKELIKKLDRKNDKIYNFCRYMSLDEYYSLKSNKKEL